MKGQLTNQARGIGMKRNGIHTMMALAASLAVLLVGCGGGGGGGEGGQASSPPPTLSAPSLAWDPPTTFSDNTIMDPYAELDYYELYLRTDANFTENDAPIAQVSAVTNVLAQDGNSYVQSLTTMFDLNNLVPFTQGGRVYYLSIKSVGVDGLKSSFSAPVAWNHT